jgi:transcriptional regulator with XRE-family HTH domain
MNTPKELSAPSIRINRRYAEMLLAASGVSRTALARKADVHPVTVSKVLRNRRHVSPEKRQAVLRSIADLCNATLDELVLGRAA